MKAVKQRTKKPIPATRAEWLRESEGIRQFLDKLANVTQPELQVWKRKMVRYYSARMRDLLDHKPKRRLRRKS